MNAHVAYNLARNCVEWARKALESHSPAWAFHEILWAIYWREVARTLRKGGDIAHIRSPRMNESPPSFV